MLALRSQANDFPHRPLGNEFLEAVLRASTLPFPGPATNSAGTTLRGFLESLLLINGIPEVERHPLGVPNITLPRVWDAGTNSIQAVSLVRRRFHLIPVILATVSEKPASNRLLPQTARFRAAQPKQQRDLPNRMTGRKQFDCPH